MEVNGCTVQTQQQASLFDRIRCVAEIVRAQRFRVELLLRRALPEELEIDAGGERFGLGQQRIGRRGRKREQATGALDFAALA